MFSPNAYPFPLFVDFSLGTLAAVEIALVTIYTLPISFLNIKRSLIQWAAFSAFLRWAELLYYPTCIFFVWVIVFESYECLFGEVVGVAAQMKMQSRFLLALFNYVLLRLLKRMYFLVRNNAEAYLRFEEGSIREREIKESVDDFVPPSLQSMKLQLGVYRWVASPRFYGWENIPDKSTKPLIFIGNHSIIALEVPLLLYELYKQKHIFPRAMGDHTHFKVPIWGKILSAFGVVDGTREVCGRILSQGQHILIYPGGAREAMKKKTDKKYSLQWANRTGFARMAIQYNATIIPVVSVGTEDMLEILYDLPAGWLFGGRAITAPIVISSPSKLQRIYFHFGTPIETDQYRGDYENMANCEHLRDLTKKAVEKGLEYLQEIQSKDPDRLVIDRVSKRMLKLKGGLGNLSLKRESKKKGIRDGEKEGKEEKSETEEENKEEKDDKEAKEEEENKGEEPLEADQMMPNAGSTDTPTQVVAGNEPDPSTEKEQEKTE